MVKRGRETWPSRKLTSIQASGKIEQHSRRRTETCDPPGSDGRVHLRGCPEKYVFEELEEKYQKFGFDEENHKISFLLTVTLSEIMP